MKTSVSKEKVAFPGSKQLCRHAIFELRMNIFVKTEKFAKPFLFVYMGSGQIFYAKKDKKNLGALSLLQIKYFLFVGENATRTDDKNAPGNSNKKSKKAVPAKTCFDTQSQEKGAQ